MQKADHDQNDRPHRILVPDLEEGIRRWSAMTGYIFSPIARYRTDRYHDRSSELEHLHDARISFSLQGAPYIELMEFHGFGTHSPEQGAGIHHLAFTGYDDLTGEIARVKEQGVAIDGQNHDSDGRVILCFTDPSALDGIRLEYVAATHHPLVSDDGSALDVDDDGLPSLWPTGSRPDSRTDS